MIECTVCHSKLVSPTTKSISRAYDRHKSRVSSKQRALNVFLVVGDCVLVGLQVSFVFVPIQVFSFPFLIMFRLRRLFTQVKLGICNILCFSISFNPQFVAFELGQIFIGKASFTYGCGNWVISQSPLNLRRHLKLDTFVLNKVNFQNIKPQSINGNHSYITLITASLLPLPLSTLLWCQFYYNHYFSYIQNVHNFVEIRYTITFVSVLHFSFRSQKCCYSEAQYKILEKIENKLVIKLCFSQKYWQLC